jgi:hypothetical protein
MYRPRLPNTDGGCREHLYRRHRAPTQCPRCWIEFKNYEGLGFHLNQTVRCEQQLSQQVEGITSQQLEKLKSKKRACSDQTEEDRWREVYRICFPEEIVPTPCRRIKFHCLFLLNLLS